jgi:AraC-like DNA-binding protein
MGYESVSAFIAGFREHFGVTPGKYFRSWGLSHLPPSHASLPWTIRYPDILEDAAQPIG